MSEAEVQDIHIRDDDTSGREAEADYTLENRITCPHCERDLEVLKKVSRAEQN